jgi:O-antigen/teichoic acid export membrane protein
MSKFIIKIKSRIRHKRDRIYIKNLFQIFIFYGFSSCASIFIIPLSLGFLDQERYGLWLVINSVFAWIGFFNLGLGAGLRLKLAETLALKNVELSRKYVSTVYFIIGIIAAVIIILFIILNRFINWTALFNASPAYQSDINATIVICTAAIVIRFILSLILNILEADQKIGLIKIFPLFTNILIIILLIVTRNFTNSSLFNLTLAIFIPEIIVYSTANIVLFKTKYRSIIPSIAEIYFPFAGDLIKVGLKFFIIQIALIILFTTDNIILTKLFDPSVVAPYNIALQYMGYASAVFYLILNPSLSAFTEAHAKKDTIWIKNTINRLIIIWCILCFILVIMVFISPVIYKVWLGNEITISQGLTTLMAIYTAISAWNSIFGNYNSGIGKLHLTMILCIIIIIINIPLSIYLARDLAMGPNGVILASIICLGLGAVFTPLQTYLLVRGKAKGIWAK